MKFIVLFPFFAMFVSGAFYPHPAAYNLQKSDNIESEVLSFLNVLKDAIENRNEFILKGMFSDSFSFTGCTHNLDRKTVVNLLLHIPGGTPVDVKLHWAKKTNNGIQYSTTVSSASRSYQAVYNIVYTGNNKYGSYQLIGGLAVCH